MRLKSVQRFKSELEASRSYLTPELFDKIQVVEGHDAKRNVVETLDHVLSTSSPNEVVLVCGSFFIMTDVRMYLGLIENSEEEIDMI
mmetsp:Transcript_39601/g.60589  ORF Transcript_39601/g.60589 Transcript_39601/m.60589 type:complete len:87 (+) Transcript_39601:1382-1642(+)